MDLKFLNKNMMYPSIDNSNNSNTIYSRKAQTTSINFKALHFVIPHTIWVTRNIHKINKIYVAKSET